MITLKKMSHLTGFSVSTISKALNDKHDINIETRKMIQDFAFKSHYKPNKNAIALRSSKSFIIAVVVSQINHDINSELLYHIQKCASKFGYRIMLFQSFEQDANIKKHLEEVNDGSVDAAIVINFQPHSLDLTIMQELKYPIDFIQISKGQSITDLQASCEAKFDQLIKKMK